MGTRGFVVATITLVAACVDYRSTKSTTGALVTDVRVEPSGLAVSSCELTFKVIEDQGLLGSDHTSRIMKLAQCEVEHRRLPPGIRAAPAPAPRPGATSGPPGGAW